MKPTNRLSKTAAASLELVAQLAAHLDAREQYLSVSRTKLIGWGLRPTLDPRRRFTAVQRERIYARDGGRCFYCASAVSADAWEADHVLPWSRGGATDIINGVVACGACNNAKSDRVW